MCAHPTAQVLSEHFHRVIVVERDHPEVNNSMTALDMAKQTAHEETRPGVTQVSLLVCLVPLLHTYNLAAPPTDHHII